MNSDKNFPDQELQEAFKKLVSEDENVVYMEELKIRELDDKLNSWLVKTIILEDESLDLGVAHKNISGRDVFFVLNDSEKEARTRITFNTKGSLEEWDPESGSITSFTNGSQLVLKPYHGKIYRAIP